MGRGEFLHTFQGIAQGGAEFGSPGLGLLQCFGNGPLQHQTRIPGVCAEGDAKRRYGRIFEAGEATHGFSVDVVDITDLVGNHHRHPTGEIDMIMPVTPEARFDGRGAGWLVYAPGTGHRPTVSAGRALILYLLPDGKIEWTSE